MGKHAKGFLVFSAYYLVFRLVAAPVVNTVQTKVGLVKSGTNLPLVQL